MNTSDNLRSRPVTNAFFNQVGIVSHQLRSYDHFIQEGIRSIINENRVVDITSNGQSYKIEFGDYLFKPPMYKTRMDKVKRLTPKIAHDLGLTYASEFLLNFDIHMPSGIIQNHTHVPMGKIPVMVYSAICNLTNIKDDHDKLIKYQEDITDVGAYFVMDGSLRVVSCKEEMISSYIYTNAVSKDKTGKTHFTRIHSSPIDKRRETRFTVGIKDASFFCKLPYIDDKIDIPFCVLLFALDLTEPREILKLVTESLKDRLSKFQIEKAAEYIENTLDKTYAALNGIHPMTYIGNLGKTYATVDDDDDIDKAIHENLNEFATHVIDNEFLPHMGQGAQYRNAKLYFVSYLIKHLLLVHFGFIPPDDRDHMAYKQIGTPGMMMEKLFGQVFSHIINDMRKSVTKSIESNDTVNIKSYLGSKYQTITNAFRSAIKDNRWEYSKQSSVNISQSLDNFNYTAGIQCKRKVQKNFDKDIGLSKKPRELNGGDWGAKCAASTPEGKQVGLNSEFPATTTITTGQSPMAMLNIIRNLDLVSPIDGLFPSPKVSVILVNGTIAGTTTNPEKVYQRLKQMKRQMDINVETSIVYDDVMGDIFVFTQKGRIIRPVFVLNKDQTFVADSLSIPSDQSPWGYYLLHGAIEWLSKIEEDFVVVAEVPSKINSNTNYDYCDISPDNMYGIGASTIPFSNHNQAPRNAYQVSMGKQAIGVPSHNVYLTLHGKSYVMNYPQKPLSYTNIAKEAHLIDLPTGQNTLICITAFEGYNQEDSVVLNKASIDRGYGDCTILTVYEYEIQQDKGDRLAIPTRDNCNNFSGGTHLLNPDTCTVLIGQRVQNNDILIGVISDDGEGGRSTSVRYNHEIPGIVYRVVEYDRSGYSCIAVVIAQHRPLMYGDKMASPHANKGTVGMSYCQEDLPCLLNGMIPEIFVNILAFPSRMTFGMLFESLTGRKICSTYLIDEPISSFKENYDATPFNNEVTFERIASELVKCGISGFSEEKMIDGRTGKMIDSLVFNGIGYYQRLKHLSGDKIHSRSYGQRDRLTRQPIEGRSSNGGLRAGTMERDNFFGNGCVYIAKDRLLDRSDATKVPFCKLCGLMAIDSLGSKKYGIADKLYCKMCDTNEVDHVIIPYATKLYIQEAMTMNTIIRIIPTSAKYVSLYAGNTIIGNSIMVV